MSLFILDQNASGTDGAAMSRSSFASFHLTGIKPSSGKLMTSSVDRLFENESDVFISSNYNEFNQVRPPERNMCVENVLKKKCSYPIVVLQGLPSIQETASTRSKSPEQLPANLNKVSKQLVDSVGQDSQSTTPSTAKSSRRDSLNEKTQPTQAEILAQMPMPAGSGAGIGHAAPSLPPANSIQSK